MKRKHMLCRLLLAAVLTGGVFVSCEGGDHQTPPPLSGNGGTGGNEPDGGDEPSGSDGYPAGLTVEAFADDLSGGGQCLGFYAVADLKANPKLRFCPQFSATKRPTEYFADFAASGKGVPCVVVNGGFFGGTTSEALRRIDEQTLLQVFEGVPQFRIARAGLGLPFVELAAEKTQVFPSKGECRKLVQGGGVSLNKEKVTDPMREVTDADLIAGKYLLVQRGKKNYYLVIAE